MKKIALILLVFFYPFALSARESAPDTKQEIKEISNRLKSEVPSGFQRLLPDISAIGTFTGAYFSQDPTSDTGADPAKTGFNLQEIELAVQSTIDPYLKGDIFLSFGEDKVELEEGYLTTLGLIKGLQMRGGKFRLPIGRQNQKHTEIWDFADNNLVNKYLLGPDGIRELGLEVSYLLPTPFFAQIQGTFSNGDNVTSFGSPRKKDFLYQGRVTTSFDPTENTAVLVGVSGATGGNSHSNGNFTQILGGDVLLKWKPASYRSLVWQTEYLYRSLGTSTGSLNDGGLYSYIDYQFLKRWHTGIRYDQMGMPSRSIVSEARITPALTFNPTEFSRIRAQYEYDKAKGANPIHAAFLQLEFSMGPHGAHAF